MTEHKHRAVLAVLIDAENVPAKIADGLFDEIANYGHAAVRRAYGDFSTTQTAAWAEKCARHAIVPQHSGTYGRGKNAADIALVIDGMDLLHSGRFDGFCIVSTDSDFVGLAIRLREQGLDVFGFGGEHTPERFRQACRRFTFVENLLQHAPANDPNSRTKPLQSPTAAIPVLKKAVARIDNHDEWTTIRSIESELSIIATDFDPRTFGYGTLIDLLHKLKEVAVDLPSDGEPRMRFKGKAKSKTSSALGKIIASGAPIKAFPSTVNRVSTKPIQRGSARP
jgi:hypothetical protein